MVLFHPAKPDLPRQPIKNPPPAPSTNPDALQQAISICADARVLLNRAAHTIGIKCRLGIRSVDIANGITYLIADMNRAIEIQKIERETA